MICKINKISCKDSLCVAPAVLTPSCPGEVIATWGTSWAACHQHSNFSSYLTTLQLSQQPSAASRFDKSTESDKKLCWKMPLSALFLPFSLCAHSLTLSAQARSGRTEMAFWVTRAGYAICRVNWRKRIEKEVETNDDGLAMIVLHPLSLSSTIVSLWGHWSPNNIATIPVRVWVFTALLIISFFCGYSSIEYLHFNH